VSPDAAHIAWLGGAGADIDGIWVMGIGGEALHRIDATPKRLSYESIEWSPTSQRLAFNRCWGPPKT
jgi:hypothetical protein